MLIKHLEKKIGMQNMTPKDLTQEKINTKNYLKVTK